MQVFLIHGMGRSRISMAPLSWFLRRRGHTTSLFGYSVAAQSLDAIAVRFLEHMRAKRSGRQDRPYAVIGHSLGNIITRHLTGRLPDGLARFVMLAPPNRPPALARAGRHRWLYRAATGDAGQHLGDHGFYRNLKRPEAPTLIIAGNRSSRLLAYRGSETNDGIVSVEETRLEGVPHRIVPAVHTLIMNHAQTRTLVAEFLQHGDASRLS